MTATGNAIPSRDVLMDYQNPSRVCDAFVTTIFKRDTETDDGPAQSYRRARPYAIPGLVDEVPRERDARWTVWKEHRAYTKVTLKPAYGEQPPDSASEAFRQVRADIAPIGRDGWKGEVDRRIAYCTLRRVGNEWRVASYETPQVAGSVR